MYYYTYFYTISPTNPSPSSSRQSRIYSAQHSCPSSRYIRQVLRATDTFLAAPQLRDLLPLTKTMQQPEANGVTLHEFINDCMMHLFKIQKTCSRTNKFMASHVEEVLKRNMKQKEVAKERLKKQEEVSKHHIFTEDDALAAPPEDDETYAALRKPRTFVSDGEILQFARRCAGIDDDIAAVTASYLRTLGVKELELTTAELDEMLEKEL